MSEQDRNILNDIIKLEGDCLSSERCKRCPLLRKCLPSFITENSKMSKVERVNRAINETWAEDFESDTLE